MKPPLALLALLSLALFSGCESLSDATTSVREKIAAREQARTHLYQAPQRATYEAARVAVEQMGLESEHLHMIGRIITPPIKAAVAQESCPISPV